MTNDVEVYQAQQPASKVLCLGHSKRRRQLACGHITVVDIKIDPHVRIEGELHYPCPCCTAERAKAT